MNYPLISEYIEAIKSVEDNFEELSYLKPVLGDDGSPVMTSGNFAVVFKMKDEQSGKFYAVKCFTKEQKGRAEAYKQISEELKDVDSPYLTSVRYLDKELFVDTKQTKETEFPVLLMDWVEGKTLDKYLRENLEDKYALEMLAYRFSQLAQWLIPQPFAHGDLKPDNIIVREDGTLVLVDYDGMYVPAMKGQKARELGSPDFRHPLRTEDIFDDHIDDFPLVSILLSLKAISFNSLLLNDYGAPNRLLLSVLDYYDIKKSEFLKSIMPSGNRILDMLSFLFCVVYYNNVLDPSIFSQLYQNKPLYLIPYRLNNEQYTLFNKKNNKLLDCRFNYISFVDPTLQSTTSCIISNDYGDCSSGFTNAAIISKPNDLINIRWYKLIFVIRNNKTRFIAKDYSNRFGIIDDTNQVLLNFEFQEIVPIESDNNVYLKIKRHGSYGLLNIDLKVIIPCILKGLVVNSSLNIIVYYRDLGSAFAMDLSSLEECSLPSDYNRIVNYKEGILTFVDANYHYSFYSFQKQSYINNYKYHVQDGIPEFKNNYTLCKRKDTYVLLSRDGTESFVDFPGKMSHYGDTIIGVITIDIKYKGKYGLEETKYSHKVYVFKKNKQFSLFSYISYYPETFELINENTICVSFLNIKKCYIDLKGEPTKYISKDTIRKKVEQNLWLVELVKSKYLNSNYIEGFNNISNDRWCRLDVTSIGDVAFVSIHFSDPNWTDEEEFNEAIGYADEDTCYWSKDCIINIINQL